MTRTHTPQRPAAYRFGTWQVERALGEGATGSVYACTNVHAPELRSAVKELRPDGDRDSLRREAAILATLDHPGVVRVRDFAVEETAWLVMDLIDGESLDGRLPLPPATALATCRALAEAVAYLHAAGVAHRDLKPANVRLAAGRPVIVDFGLGSAVGRGVGDRSGTLDHVAPELLDEQAGDLAPDRGDVYALGLLFAEIWGAPAARAPDAGPELLRWVRERRRRPEVDLGDVAPPEVRALVLTMTARSPHARPSAAAVVEALPAPAAPAAVPSARGPRPRRRLGWALAAAAAAVAALSGALMPTARAYLACRPTAERFADGVDQDCDGADRRLAWLVDSGGKLTLTSGGADRAASLAPGARLLATAQGRWVATPEAATTRIARLRDDLTLEAAVVVEAAGRVAPDAAPDSLLLVDASAGTVHRVGLLDGRVRQSVSVPGVQHAIGRVGAPDFWAVIDQPATGTFLTRVSWIGQHVGAHRLPGPVSGLVAVGEALVVTGAWGAGVLAADQLRVLPPPPGLSGAPTSTFTDPVAARVWVGDADSYAVLRLDDLHYGDAAPGLASPLDADAPWFPAGTTDIVGSFDADGDGWPSTAQLDADCDDHDPHRHPGAAEAPADGVDADCDRADDPRSPDAGATSKKTRWSVLDALEWSPLDTPARILVADQAYTVPPGGDVEFVIPPGVEAVRVEAPGYMPVLRPVGHGAAAPENPVLLLPVWSAAAAGPKYGAWLRPGAGGLLTVAVERRDARANFPGVHFAVEPSPEGAYVAGGPLDGTDVREQQQYGWLFWRGMDAGPKVVTVTPPDGARCWLPGAAAPVTAPLTVDVTANTLTYLLVACEDGP